MDDTSNYSLMYAASRTAHAKQDRVLLDRALTLAKYDLTIDERLTGRVVFHAFNGEHKPSEVGVMNAERKLKFYLRDSKMLVFSSIRLAFMDDETPALVDDEILYACFGDGVRQYSEWLGDLNVKTQYYKKLQAETETIGVLLRELKDWNELYDWYN